MLDIGSADLRTCLPVLPRIAAGGRAELAHTSSERYHPSQLDVTQLAASRQNAREHPGLAHPVLTRAFHCAQTLGAVITQFTANQALLIWDHGVLMREKVIYWDCVQNKALPQSVREQVIRLHRITTECLFAAADMIVPCNATFNTKWEVRQSTLMQQC